MASIPAVYPSGRSVSPVGHVHRGTSPESSPVFLPRHSSYHAHSPDPFRGPSTTVLVDPDEVRYRAATTPAPVINIVSDNRPRPPVTLHSPRAGHLSHEKYAASYVEPAGYCRECDVGVAPVPVAGVSPVGRRRDVRVPAQASEINIIATPVRGENPVIDSALAIASGNPPRNDEIIHSLRLTKAALRDERGRDPYLTDKGQRIASHTEDLINATERIILEKNHDEKIQQILIDSKEFGKDAAKTGPAGIRGLMKRTRTEWNKLPGDKMKKQGTEVLVNTRKLIYLVVTNDEFRSLLAETVQLLRKMIVGGKAQPSTTTTTSIPSKYYYYDRPYYPPYQYESPYQYPAYQYPQEPTVIPGSERRYYYDDQGLKVYLDEWDRPATGGGRRFYYDDEGRKVYLDPAEQGWYEPGREQYLGSRERLTTESERAGERRSWTSPVAATEGVAGMSTAWDPSNARETFPEIPTPATQETQWVDPERQQAFSESEGRKYYYDNDGRLFYYDSQGSKVFVERESRLPSGYSPRSYDRPRSYSYPSEYYRPSDYYRSGGYSRPSDYCCATDYSYPRRIIREPVSSLPVQDDRHELALKLNTIIAKFGEREEFRNAIKALFDLFRYVRDTPSAFAKDSSVTAVTGLAQSPSLNKTWTDTKELIERWTGRGSIDNLLKHSNSLLKTVRTSPNANTLFHDVRQHVLAVFREGSGAARDPFYVDRTEQLMTRAQNLLTEEIYKQHVTGILDESSQILNRMKSDDATLAWASALKKLAEDLVLSTDGKFSFWTLQESLTQVRSMMIPILVRLLSHIRLPRIEGSTPKYDYAFDNLVFSGSDILPEFVSLGLDDASFDMNVTHLQPHMMKAILKLRILNIRTHLYDIEFYFKRKIRPKLKDEGIVDVHLGGDGTSIEIDWRVKIGYGMPLSFKAIRALCRVDDLTVDFKAADHRTVDRFVSKVFLNTARAQVEKAIAEKLLEFGIKMSDYVNKAIAKFYPEKLLGWYGGPGFGMPAVYPPPEHAGRYGRYPERPLYPAEYTKTAKLYEPTQPSTVYTLQPGRPPSVDRSSVYDYHFPRNTVAGTEAVYGEPVVYSEYPTTATSTTTQKGGLLGKLFRRH